MCFPHTTAFFYSVVTFKPRMKERVTNRKVKLKKQKSVLNEIMTPIGIITRMKRPVIAVDCHTVQLVLEILVHCLFLVPVTPSNTLVNRYHNIANHSAI